MDHSQLVQRLYQELSSLKGDADSDSQTQLTEPVLQASAVYLARSFHSWNLSSGRLNQLQNGGVPIAFILQNLNISVYDFFTRFPIVLELIAPKFPTVFEADIAEEWILHLNDWRRQLVYSMILSKKYKDLFCFLFNVSMENILENKVFRFGWLMFVFQKSQLISELPDLESCFHLLLCILNFLLVNTPGSFWKSGFLSLLKMHNLEDANHLSILKKLAIVNNISGAEEYEKLNQMMISVESSIFSLLNNQMELHQTPPIPEDAPSQSTTQNVLDPERRLLDESLEMLDLKYAEYLSTVGEFDERLFIQKSTQAHPASTMNTRTSLWTSGRLSMDQPDSNPAICNKSPSFSLQGWLLHFSEDLSLQPSEEFQSSLNAEECELIVELNTLLHFYAMKLFPSESSTEFCPPQEGICGIKVFYFALIRFLSKYSEKRITLLKSRAFSRALMACAFETVVFSFSLEHLQFPVLLNLLQLKAFDLSKITELFIQLLPEIPEKIKEHFVCIEHQIIESLAWVSGSYIFPLLSHASLIQNAKKADEMEINEPLFPSTRPPIPGLSPDQRSRFSAFKVVPSSRPDPKRTVREVVRSVEVIPESLGPAEDVHMINSLSRAILEDFFRKELKLVALRLSEFKAVLDFSPLPVPCIMIQVYKVMKYALYEQTSLFYNRHLDQLLMSALYGVCKVNRLNIAFKDIIAKYRAFPRHSSDVYQSVILRQANPSFTVEKMGDIIGFYNVVFVPRMESCLVKGSTLVNSITDTKKVLDLDGPPLACEVVCPWLVQDLNPKQ